MLREEINEARTLLISRDSLIKTLQQELAESSNSRKINTDLKVFLRVWIIIIILSNIKKYYKSHRLMICR